MGEFAAATPPGGEATRAAPDALGLDTAEAFRVLARDDLVHVDASGRPNVATTRLEAVLRAA